MDGEFTSTLPVEAEELIVALFKGAIIEQVIPKAEEDAAPLATNNCSISRFFPSEARVVAVRPEGKY